MVPLVLLGLLSFLPSSHGDDPARFLGVEEWQGTLTHSLTEGGSTTVDDCNVTWDASHNVNANFTLANGNGAFGIKHWDTTFTASSFVLGGSYAELMTIECPDNPAENTQYTAEPDLGRIDSLFVSIKVDANNNTYDVGILATVPALFSFTGCPICPLASGSEWYPETNILDLPLPATGMTLSGSTTIDMTGCNSCGVYFTTPIGVLGGDGSLGGSLTVTWNFTGKSDLKLLITPLEEYQDWLPKGNIPDQAKRGNFVKVKARLVKANGQPAEVKAKKFTFKLADVSAEPGICLNYPSAGDANPDPDLGFEYELSQMHPATWIISDDSKQADTVDGEYTEITVTVSAYDFGAYGELTVTADVGGTILEGKLESDESKKKVLLPRRQEDSKVAEAWKSSAGAAGKADDADDDNDPLGDGHTGDGYTVYEEYRGFIVNRKHTRDGQNPLSPQTKDLFVRSKTTLADDGIGLFDRLTGLNVITKFRADEFPDNRIMNFNHSGQFHSVDQHGILIEAKGTNSFAVALPEDHPPDTPKSTTLIQIPVTLRSFGSGVTALGVSYRGSTDYRAAVVAHEMGHACGIYHHGDAEEKEVRWRIFQNGTNTVLREDASLGDIEIVVRSEQGSDLTARLIGLQAALGNEFLQTIALGLLNSSHSGDVNCIMRYNSAIAYRARPAGFPSTRYWVGSELIGGTLCTAPAGTIMNATSWVPHSRYGDCAPGRGKCKDQLCVNDLYNGDSSHSR